MTLPRRVSGKLLGATRAISRSCPDHATRSSVAQGVATWEAESVFDTFWVVCYSLLVSSARGLLILLGLLVLTVQVVAGAIAGPEAVAFTLLSVVPALLLAGYVWYTDVTTPEPLGLLAVTFVLGVLFAGFAAIINTGTDTILGALGLSTGFVGFLFQILTFFVVVGPVEETVKLLAVYFYAYRSSRFDAVVDGAVYGAVAGLGFATIENAIFISGPIQGVSDPLNLITTGSAVTAVRGLAGPGHVIYSAFAGYYLGLAKFNPDRAGPLVLKGLTIAALIHAVYNTLSSVVPSVVATTTGVPWFVAFVALVVVYDGLLLSVLYWKLHRYRRAYQDAYAETDHPAELTEFDP
jgi:RsiW-degrading membrane proteinase PrsW (M82 family)